MAASGLNAGRAPKSVSGNVMAAGKFAVAQSAQNTRGPSMRKPTSVSAANPKSSIKGLTGPIKGPDKGTGAA